jgi:hypothetical protein
MPVSAEGCSPDLLADKPQTMKAKTDCFRIRGQAQERMKLPGIFWAEVDRPHSGCRPAAQQPAAHALQRGEFRDHDEKLLDLAGRKAASPGAQRGLQSTIDLALGRD